MSETNERSVASDGSGADIIDRLCDAVEEDEPPRRALMVSAAAEIERLRFAIRRLAEQDATLSVCEGTVTVTMDATLTDSERKAIASAIDCCEDITYGGAANQEAADVLKALLERTK